MTTLPQSMPPPLLSPQDILMRAEQWQNTQEKSVGEQAHKTATNTTSVFASGAIVAILVYALTSVPLQEAAGTAIVFFSALAISIAPIYLGVGVWALHKKCNKHAWRWTQEITRFKELLAAQQWTHPELKRLTPHPEHWRVLTPEEIDQLNSCVRSAPEHVRQHWPKMLESAKPLRVEQQLWVEEQCAGQATAVDQALSDTHDPAAQKQLAHRMQLRTQEDGPNQTDSVVVPVLSVLEALNDNKPSTGVVPPQK